MVMGNWTSLCLTRLSRPLAREPRGHFNVDLCLFVLFSDSQRWLPLPFPRQTDILDFLNTQGEKRDISSVCDYNSDEGDKSIFDPALVGIPFRIKQTIGANCLSTYSAVSTRL